MSSTLYPSKQYGHGVLSSSLQMYQLLTVLLDGGKADGKILEELILFYLDNYRLRAKNEDAVQLDFDISRQDKSSEGSYASIKLYKGDYTFTDCELAKRMCEGKILRHTDESDNSAQNFLSKLLVLASIPVPQCSQCDETCYKGAVFCHHCITSTRLNLHGAGATSSRNRYRLSPGYDSDTPPLFLRPTCVNCRARYKCPAYKSIATTRSGSLCKQTIIVFRYSLESLSALVNLAFASLDIAEPSTADNARLAKLRGVITPNTWRALQKCPRLSDIVDLYMIKKSVLRSWQRTLDSADPGDEDDAITGVAESANSRTNGSSPGTGYRSRKFKFQGEETTVYQIDEPEFFQPMLKPLFEILRCDVSWLYCWMAFAPQCASTTVDPDEPPIRYT